MSTSNIVIKTSEVLERLCEYTNSWCSAQNYLQIHDACLLHADYFIDIEDSTDKNILSKFLTKVHSALFDASGKTSISQKSLVAVAQLIVDTEGCVTKDGYTKFLNDEMTYSFVFFNKNHSDQLSKALTASFLSDI